MIKEIATAVFMSEWFWAFIIQLGIILFLCKFLRPLELIAGALGYAFHFIKEGIKNIYTKFMLKSYCRKNKLKVSDYKKKVSCELKGITYRNEEGENVIIIKHPQEIKPIIKFGYFLCLFGENFDRRRSKRDW